MFMFHGALVSFAERRVIYMKIVVVGLGSMGQRRIRLLKKIDSSIELIGVDSSIERCDNVAVVYGIKTNLDLIDALREIQPDAVIVSTPPMSHAAIIGECLQAKCHVFTELNLVDDGYKENIELAKKKNKELFLSSTFLYRDEIRYIKKMVEPMKGHVNYTYHVGQYLPDWHPWENIENYFVSDVKTNGCRELLAIELPWIIKTFGEIESVNVASSRKTKLNIKYNDNYIILVQHKNGTFGSLAVDVISRKPVRNLEIYGEKIYISWNGTPDSLREYDFNMKMEKKINLYKRINKNQNYASFIIENAYENELRTFLNQIKQKDEAEYTFEDDLKTISLINNIERVKIL